MIAPLTNPSFAARLWSGFAGLALGALSGCQFVVPGLMGQDASMEDAASADGLGSRDLLGTLDANTLADLSRLDLAATPDLAAPNDASIALDMAMPGAPPILTLPSNTQIIPPTRAYLYWKNGPIPMGLSVSDYQVCSTSGAMTLIDDDNECPNPATPVKPHHVIDPLTPSASYFYKVRTRYNNGSYSAWSALQTFATDNSLAAWWRLNGNAQDTKGLNNAALQNGAGYANGIDGQALQCDGVDDHADAGGGLNLPGPLAVSAWVYGSGIPVTADSGIVNKGILNYALTYHTNGQVYFYIGMGGNNLSIPMTPNAWHHVTGVFNGTTNNGGMRLYLDGAPVASKASAVATTGAAGNLYLGRYDIHYFKGLIDNVTLYSSALTDTQVLNEFCATQAAGGVDPLPASCTP